MRQNRCFLNKRTSFAATAALCALLLLLQLFPIAAFAATETENDTALPLTTETEAEETEEAEVTTVPPVLDLPETAGNAALRLNFQDIGMQQKFESEKNTAAVKYMAENDLAFTRFTVLTANAVVRYTEPLSLSATDNRYVAVSYRASAGVSTEFAFAFSSDVHKTPAYTNAVVLRDIAEDGAWHTVVVDMRDNTGWSGTISDLTLYFYHDASSPAGETFDISFIAFYQERPTFANEYNSVIHDDPNMPSDTNGGATASGSEPAGAQTSGKGDPSVIGGPFNGAFPWLPVLAAMGIFLVLGVVVGILARSGKKAPYVVIGEEDEEDDEDDADEEDHDDENRDGEKDGADEKGDDAGSAEEKAEHEDGPENSSEDADTGNDSTTDATSSENGSGE